MDRLNEEKVLQSFKLNMDIEPRADFVKELEEKLVMKAKKMVSRQNTMKVIPIVSGLSFALLLGVWFTAFDGIQTIRDGVSNGNGKDTLFQGSKRSIEETLAQLSYKIKQPTELPFEVHQGQATIRLVDKQDQEVEIVYRNDVENIKFGIGVDRNKQVVPANSNEGRDLNSGAKTNFYEDHDSSALIWREDGLNYRIFASKDGKVDGLNSRGWSPEAFLTMDQMVEIANTFRYDAKPIEFTEPQQKVNVEYLDHGFLKAGIGTGSLKDIPIQIGQTKKEVLDLLGDPIGASNGKYGINLQYDGFYLEFDGYFGTVDKLGDDSEVQAIHVLANKFNINGKIQDIRSAIETVAGLNILGLPIERENGPYYNWWVTYRDGEYELIFKFEYKGGYLESFTLTKDKINQNWDISPTFILPVTIGDKGKGELTLIGKEGKLGLQVQQFIKGNQDKLFWYFWDDSPEETNQLIGKRIDIIGTTKEVANEEATVHELYSGMLNASISDNDKVANGHSLITFPTEGIWKLDAYVDDKFFGSIVVEVQ